MSKKIIRIKQIETSPNLCKGCLADSWNGCNELRQTMEDVGLGDCEEGSFNFIYVIKENDD